MPDKNELVPRPGWGSLDGHIAVGRSVPLGTDTQAISDRHLIVERINRYGWACDECLEEQFADCFAEDSTWTGNLFASEIVGPIVGKANIVAWMIQWFPGFVDQRRHNFMNIIVDGQTETTATVLANIIITGAASKVVTLRATGFYKLNLVKVGEEWLIKDLYGGFDTPW